MSALRRGALVALLALTGAAAPAVAATTTAPAAPAAQSDARYDDDTVLVAFDPSTAPTARAEAHRSENARVANSMEWLNLDVVELPEGVDPAVAAQRYERRPGVAYAHPNWEVRLQSQPNDLLFKDLWGLHNTGQSVTGSFVQGLGDTDLDAPEAWDTAYGAGIFPSSGGARVGILDTGIDQSHTDLLGKTKACASAVSGLGVVVNGSCHDDNLHGTHVAGTIGAIANNSLGVAGVAPNAEFSVFKALNSAGVGFYADIVAGVKWLETRSQIISMSIGGPQDESLDTQLTQTAAAGVLLIAAAGNDGDATLNYPAAHGDVMSVTAIDAGRKLASFGNCNSDVEIAAPGVDVWSTTPGNSYASLNGTSMATPHVSGAAAVVMWKNRFTAAETRKALLSGTEYNVDCRKVKTVGIVNLALALGGGTPTTDPGAISGTVTEHRTNNRIASATVECGTAGTATTDTNGTYSITGVTPGTYTCTASKSGYQSKSANVSVTSGTTSEQNFTLRKR